MPPLTKDLKSLGIFPYDSPTRTHTPCFAWSSACTVSSPGPDGSLAFVLTISIMLEIRGPTPRDNHEGNMAQGSSFLVSLTEGFFGQAGALSSFPKHTASFLLAWHALTTVKPFTKQAIKRSQVDSENSYYSTISKQRAGQWEFREAGRSRRWDNCHHSHDTSHWCTLDPCHRD